MDGARCHYCQGDLPVIGAAIDRKGNTQGYTLDNVVPCCTHCNNTKRTRTSYEEMMTVAPLLRAMRRRGQEWPHVVTIRSAAQTLKLLAQVGVVLPAP